MAAPSDDFETADYDALRACSLTARGLWADMRVLMKRSRRRGYLHLEGKPMSLRQLALTTGCNTDEARSHVEELIAAGICAHSEAEGYFSPRIVAFETFRQKCSEAGKKGKGNPALRRERTFKGRSKGWSKGTARDAPSPSPGPPPPNPQEPIAAQSGGGAALPRRIDQRAMELWREMWATAHHGAEYSPGKVDWTKLNEILGKLGARDDAELALTRWQKVARTVLKLPEEYGWEGHRLSVVVQKWPFVVSETTKAEKGIASGIHKPASAADRGEFAESALPLPILVAGAGRNGAER